MWFFAGLSLNVPIPYHSTILKFRHLLERQDLARQIFKEVSVWLSEAEVLLKEETLMDASIIEAPSSTKIKSGQRYPEVHQTKKGNQWHFGLKAHMGVDARTGLTHSFTTTAANEHDLNQAGNVLHGEEEFIFADSGYRDAENRKELEDVKAGWHVAEIPSKVKELKKHPR